MAKSKKPKVTNQPDTPAIPPISKAVPQDLPAMEGPGVSLPKFKDIDRAADAYQDAKEARMAAGKTGVKAKETLIEAMEKHDLKEYYYGDLKVKIEGGKINVKVQTVGNTEEPETTEGGE